MKTVESFTKRWIAACCMVGSIVLISVFGGFAAIADSSEPNSKPSTGVASEIRLPPSVEVGQSVQSALSGLAVPARRVTVSAPQTGVLTIVHVQEGQLVQEGQVLAEIDHLAAQAALEVAALKAIDDASVKHAEFALKHATLQLNSVIKAHKASASTDYELRQAQLRQKQARSAYEMRVNRKAIAEAALKFEQQKYDRYFVRAAFSGRAVQIFAQPGAMLRISEPLLKLVAFETLEVTIHLPVNLYGKLHEGQEYHLIADEPVGRSLTSTLKTIDATINPIRKTFRCVFTVANEDESLPAGFAVRLDTKGLEDQVQVNKSDKANSGLRLTGRGQ